MRAQAAEYLADQRAVVLDATHGRREDRRHTFALARRAGVLCLLVEVVADEDAVRRHFDARASEASAISEARWQTYREQRLRFDPIDEIADEHHIIIDGAAPLTANIDAIVEQIGSRVRRD